MTNPPHQSLEVNDLPDWAVEELRELADIEPQLYPTRNFVGRYKYSGIPVRRSLGDSYASCLEQLSDFAPDVIILVPGGDDLGVLHHVEAGISEGKRVLVISTEDAESPWRTRIPPTTRFLELGRLGRHLSENQRLSVLLRLVLQQKALVIHIINSRLGWEMVRRYGKSLLAVEKRVYASIFADGFNEPGGRSGFAIDYLVDCWPFLRAVICDSDWCRKDLIAQYGCQQEKVFTAYFPTNMEEAPVFSSPSSSRVLWAGRFAIEKRLDLLIEIARLSPELPFDVYGYAVDDYGRAMEERMLELPNVTVHGAYDSLKHVVATNVYSLLVYTSRSDGLPNLLLEATAAGLPVVASAVGGVPEFIMEETGYPVRDVNEPRAYLKRIQEAIADSEERRRRWGAAVDLLQSRHKAEVFRLRLKNIPGYFTEYISEPEVDSISESK